MTDSTPILDVVGLSKAYDNPAGAVGVLKDVNLRVQAGDAVAIVGPSGSGKSTLLHIIGGLDRPSAGEVLLDGEDLAVLSDDALAALRARSIGFVFQQHYLLPQCSVIENVVIPTLITDGAAKAMDRAHALLDRVGLSHRLTHRPAHLSGGECQRVAVVRALINEPKLLLADEPTGSLDQASADSLGALLADLNREEDVTLVVVTHSVRLARRMRRQLELRDGALVEQGAHE